MRSRVADHELDTWFLVDLSASLDFGTARHTKLELAVAAVAATGLLTATPGNRAGALLLSGDTREIVPPRGGRRHVGTILRRITNAPPAAGPTDLGGALAEAKRLIARPGLVVVVSDFLCGSPWADRLARVAQRHEVLAVEVVDPRELTLPPVGVVSLVDIETGRSRDVPTHDPRLRERYAEAAHAKRAATGCAIRDAGGGHLVLRTDRDWLTDLIAFADLRRRRGRSMHGAARHRSELGTSV